VTGRTLPVLTDGVIVLRPLQLEDAQVHLAGEDEELVRWLNGGPGTLEGVRAYIGRTLDSWAADGPHFNFGIRLADTDQLVGTMDVQLAQPYLEKDQANLAYGLYPPWRRRGLATRAVLLAVGFLERRSDLTEAVIRTAPGNQRSAAVARRAGFRFSHRCRDVHDPHDWYLLALRPDGSGRIA